MSAAPTLIILSFDIVFSIIDYRCLARPTLTTKISYSTFRGNIVSPLQRATFGCGECVLNPNKEAPHSATCFCLSLRLPCKLVSGGYSSKFT